MQKAGVAGAHASPKGLRHSLGVSALQSGVPLNILQKWLGHTHMHTTAIYSDAVGPEERKLAGRFWQGF
jgi:site-specific recombinase XerD